MNLNSGGRVSELLLGSADYISETSTILHTRGIYNNDFSVKASYIKTKNQFILKELINIHKDVEQMAKSKRKPSENIRYNFIDKFIPSTQDLIKHNLLRNKVNKSVNNAKNLKITDASSSCQSRSFMPKQEPFI